MLIDFAPSVLTAPPVLSRKMERRSQKWGYFQWTDIYMCIVIPMIIIRLQLVVPARRLP